MEYLLKPFLSSVLIFMMFPSLIHAADFNINLRKMDVNELKQQLMPTFEQNIIQLNELLACLETGKKLDTCLNDYAQNVNDYAQKESANSLADKARNKQIKQTIERKIKEKNISQTQLIAELKKLLLEAEAIKRCLYQGQTANELKNCITQF